MRPAALLFLLATAAAARAQAPFCSQIQALTADPTVAAAHWGVSVTTLTGQRLCGINDAQLFRPSSNAKLFTTAAALALLGPDNTVQTTVYQQGPDLILKGAADPALSTRPYPYTPHGQPVVNPIEALADAVAAHGLTHFTGDVIGDDTLFPSEPLGENWSVGDTLWGYGAPVSALTLADNKVTLTVSAEAGARLDTPVPYYQVVSDVRPLPAKAAAALGIARPPGSRTVEVFGTVAAGAPSTEDLALADPAEYAALLFKSLLQARGVTIDGVARARHRASRETRPLTALNPAEITPCPIHRSLIAMSGTCPEPTPNPNPDTLATHTSPTLLEDITVTLKVSQNLHAELLLHRLGLAFGTDGSTAQGCRVVRQFALQAGLRPADFTLDDGSGLSTHDLVTPRAFTQLLVYAAGQPWFAGFKAALPVGGVDGTLAGRFTEPPVKGHVFAKTGTLGESRALSGYLLTRTGQTLVFSILADTHLPSTTADRTTTDRIVTLLAAQ